MVVDRSTGRPASGVEDRARNAVRPGEIISCDVRPRLGTSKDLP